MYHTSKYILSIFIFTIIFEFKNILYFSEGLDYVEDFEGKLLDSIEGTRQKG